MRHWLACPALLLFAASSLQAHAVHQSRAEVEYNAKTHKLEVSLTVFCNDLELALIRQSEREISLVKSPAAEVDAQIRLFLTGHFMIADAKGVLAPIEWIGRQDEAASAASGAPEVTLFFEIPLPDGLVGSSLKQIVFCDHFADQLNLVHLRSGTQSTELRLTKGEPMKRLEFPQVAKP